MLKNDDGEPRCTFEPLGEYEDCETVWPTTTTTTQAVGCCYGDSYKANDKCRAMDDDQARCEKQGCTFLVTDNPDDCDVTTTDTPTTTATPGCCKGDSLKSQDKCNTIKDKDNARSSCQFIDFGVLEEDCKWEVHTDPPSEPGCCYGNPDIAYSKRWMESCKTFGTEEECLMLTNDDGEPRCYFEPLGEYEDCETVWPTTTTTTEEPGCCRDRGADARNGMCSERQGREECERSSKCEFVATDDYSDCDTTTSEPWLEAKDEEYALPFNPYKQAKKSARKGANHRQEEALLFGGDSVVGQAMQSQVSLSSVLMMAIAAFAVYQVYRWMSAHNNKDYVVTQTRPVPYYQSA